MTRAPRLTVVDAIAEIISSLSPAIIPVTTLSAPTIIGATQITLADASVAALAKRAAPGGIISFFDSTGEKPVRIKSVSGQIVTLDFTGRGVTGLQSAHSSGGTVALNIIAAPILDPGHALANGYPMVGVSTMGGKTKWSANKQTTASVGITVALMLPLAQSTAPQSRADNQLYVYDQVDRIEGYAQQIEDALRPNYTLRTKDGTSHVMEVSEFIHAAGRQDEVCDVPVLARMIDMPVLMTPQDVPPA